MPSRFAELAATLGKSMGAPKPKRKRKQRLSPSAIEDILLRFLTDDEEGSPSRLAAAKILLERLSSSTRDDDAKSRETAERATAEAEAQAVLAELAAAKFAGLSLAGAVDQDGAAGTVDAAEPPGPQA